MKSKTKAELSKMTKKNLLLHIEKMQLLIENDYLETQKANREMRDVLSKYEKDASLAKIQRGAGIMRYQVSHHNFKSLEDKKKVLKIVDIFMNTVL